MARRNKTPGIRYQGQNWYSLALVPEVEVVHCFRDNRLEIRTPNAVSATLADLPLGTPSPVTPRATPKQLAPIPATEMSAQTTALRPMPLEVFIHGAKSGSWLLLEREGVLYAPAEEVGATETGVAQRSTSTETSQPANPALAPAPLAVLASRVC